ncbi:hypothetical protein EAL2_c11010 [Peptoclostridium acidaminophilum DSM 3953]|uniref:Recombinase domain-containing protein n=1 Tax=Peptoclostridium acidaminophilum DSM 3953 TaxID=1286171 RepID=W8T3Q5_PEPAC|nr:recombinase family protein [Peptoclostridium acidaminophilum]AHM56399.1 hypothetical protein EAL2_c11010 [Peptoclostridium acidaminophilum DSM 3953]
MTYEEIKTKIKCLDSVREILEMKPRNLTEEIFLKYIELERTEKVAQYLNEQGYKTKGARDERKYISTDITEILDDESCYMLVDDNIYKLARFMKKRKYRTWEEKILKYFEERSDCDGD